MSLAGYGSCVRDISQLDSTCRTPDYPGDDDRSLTTCKWLPTLGGARSTSDAEAFELGPHSVRGGRLSRAREG